MAHRRMVFKGLGSCYECGAEPASGRALCSKHLASARLRMARHNALVVSKKADLGSITP